MLTCPHGLPYECACAECFKEAMQREQERQNPPPQPDPPKTAA